MENINYLHQLCQERGIVLGVETMYPTLPASAVENLLDNGAELAQFCQDAPQIKIVFDLAHLNIWHDKSLVTQNQWLGLPTERLLEIHISDNDGRQDIHSRITPHTWWIRHITQFPVGVPLVLAQVWGNVLIPGKLLLVRFHSQIKLPSDKLNISLGRI